MRSSASRRDSDFVEPSTATRDDAHAPARVISLFSRTPATDARRSGTAPGQGGNSDGEVHAASLADFDRDIYCLMGIPIDAVDLRRSKRHLRLAAARRQRCFLSTPNLNFLMACQRDEAFRDSLINSDLNLVDGLPLAWMARRLGIPVQSRVTGSDLFEGMMRDTDAPGGKLSVYFFGGPDGAAAAACQALNEGRYGVVGAGFQSPGFGSVEDMSRPAMIDHINASGADFLVVSLGARKGQAWIERNRSRLNVPVISHLGAVVNFVAGSVKRAPGWMQRLGLEWLWRIKEEPALWRRYWLDGAAFLRLLVTRLLPYALWLRLAWAGLIRVSRRGQVFLGRDEDGHTLRVVGGTPDHPPATLRDTLRRAAALGTGLTVDLSRADYLSPGFFGLLLVLRKHQTAAGRPLRFVGVSGRMARLFRWNGVDYLLAEAPSPDVGPMARPDLVGATSL